jgi:ABC-2 type transport system ATP-binding protein
MLQRLGLAQAMLHDPDLLILDEPTDGVDPVGRAEIREILHRLKGEGKTIFLNSHLLQEIELVCDRVAILGRGRLRRVDSVRALTGLTSPEALFIVKCDEESARRALNGRTIQFVKTIDSDHVQVDVDVPEQSGLDSCVDAFRRADVSIASVVRRHLTLEQAFLKLVQDDHPE